LSLSLGKSLRALLWAGVLIAAGQAHAQATRTWVSGVGDDANPCSRTAPCKTFAGAISKTLDGGEIDTLDPGGFGAVTITKNITIANDGVGTAGVLASGTNGITINAPAGTIISVYLRNLVIDGAPSTSWGLNGVNVVNGGDVHIDGCVIHSFRGSPGVGVNVHTSADASRVFITNTKIYGNNTGIQNTSTVSASVAIIDTVIDKNFNYGIQGTTSSAVFSLHRSVVTGNGVGISAPAPSKVNSYGNNLVTGIQAGTVLTSATLQ